MKKNTVEPKAEEKWVNLSDIAEYLSVSQDTIRNWLKTGRLPTYKAGKQYKFRRSEVDELLKEGKLAEEDVHGRESNIGN